MLVLLASCVVLLLPGHAAVDILDLPETVDETYDLHWQMHAPPGRQTLTLLLDGASGQPVSGLTFSRTAVTWDDSSHPAQSPLRRSLVYPRNRPAAITVKRRPGMLAVLLDSRLVLTAPAPLTASGCPAFRDPPAGVVTGAVRYQPIEPPHFGDDFMRPEALERLLLSGTRWIEDPVWEVDGLEGMARQRLSSLPLTNPWQLSLFPHPDTTANAFWWRYTGTGPSWVVANPTLVPRHWDRYAMSVAVRPSAGSAVGVLVAYQDADNYLLVRWRERSAQLLTVIEGKSRTLATADTGFVPDQWYTLGVVLSWMHVTVTVDGQPLLTAVNPGPIEGRIGLYADAPPAGGSPALDADTLAMYTTTDPETGETRQDPAIALRGMGGIAFDDVRVAPSADEPNLWTAPYPRTDSGRWRIHQEQMQALAAGSRTVTAPLGTDFTLTLPLQFPADGIVQCHLPLETGETITWEHTPTGQRLMRLSPDGVTTTLDERPYPRVADAWQTLRITRRGPYLACRIGSGPGVETYGVHGAATGCTVTTTRAGTRLGTLAWQVTAPAPASPPPLMRFVKDRYIRTWASAEADWVPADPARITAHQAGEVALWPTEEPGLYWYKGTAYHDLTVTLPHVPVNSLTGQTLYLTPARDPATGYALTFTVGEQGRRVEVRRDGALLATYPLTATGTATFRILRRGALLIVTVRRAMEDETEDPETTLGVLRDVTPLAVRHVGFRVTSRRLPAGALHVEAGQVRETFAAAPADWRVAHGVWAVMARYSCSPWWNWYGGFGAGRPAVWSKAALDGDQSVEAYLGVKMLVLDQPEEYRRRFRDLNLTICGDGHSVTSGYTLQRATRVDGRLVTRLLRHGVPVWTSTDPAHLVPPDGQGHRLWLATRLEKRGADVAVYLDQHLATVYRDPDPLPGGRIAIWTADNGLLIGRISYGAEHVTVRG